MLRSVVRTIAAGSVAAAIFACGGGGGGDGGTGPTPVFTSVVSYAGLAVRARRLDDTTYRNREGSKRSHFRRCACCHVDVVATPTWLPSIPRPEW